MASLKEELRATQAQLERLLERIIAPAVQPTMPSGPPLPPSVRAVPRPQGIGSRIRRAEAADRREAEPLVAERKREYEKRISDLIRPEVEIAEDDGTGA